MARRYDWQRIWSTYRSETLSPGLEARVADPLWMLSRQRQFGEFQGEDAASIVRAEIKVETVRESAMVLPNGQTADAPDLLEPAVEARDPMKGPAGYRANGEAAKQFLRRITKSKRNSVLVALQKAYKPTPLPGDDLDLRNNAKVANAIAKFAFNTSTFRLSTTQDRAALASDADVQETSFEAAFEAWKTYFDGRFVRGAGAQTWTHERLNHRFGVMAGPVAIGSDAYPGGRLDWQDFSMVDNPIANDTPSDPPKSTWMIPSQIAISGAPADRFWNFEDREVSFGGLTADGSDLAQLILTEFTTVYGNDWYMIPVKLPTGSLSRVVTLNVYDNFDAKTEIPITPCAKTDGADRDWRFFELTPAKDTIGDGGNPWMYLPRTVLGGHESAAVERVFFARDEAANLMWGIEQLIEGVSGHPVDRERAWTALRDQLVPPTDDVPPDVPAPPRAPGHEPAWLYRLLTMTPPHWVPFAAKVRNNLAENALVRSRMREWDLLGDNRDMIAGPQGRILRPDHPYEIDHDTVLRGGALVSSHYQAARRPDGTLITWASRKKRPGSGDAQSGRKTDLFEK